jgi:hypothetical protein
MLHHSMVRLSVLAVLLVVLLGASSGALPAMRAQAQKVPQACSATLGTYVVGTPQSSQSNVAGGAVLPPLILSGLSGTITVSGAPACGATYAGHFDLHLAYRPPLVEGAHPGQGSSTSATILPAPIFGTSVLTATGTFGADAAHPADPMYVAVGGTVIYGHYSYSCPPICGNQPRGNNGSTIVCPDGGCPLPRPVVSGVVHFTAVTGYVHLQGTATPALVLAFIPPPDTSGQTSGTVAFQPLVLYGRRVA